MASRNWIALIGSWTLLGLAFLTGFSIGGVVAQVPLVLTGALLGSNRGRSATLYWAAAGIVLDLIGLAMVYVLQLIPLAGLLLVYGALVFVAVVVEAVTRATSGPHANAGM